jgi:3-oxoadipate enol-lactonase
MPEITADTGVSLHYDETGRGDPVVLLHGLSFPGAAWAPIANRLADKYRVITLDNRGVRQTRAPAGPFSIQDMTDDVAAALAQVVGAPAHIAGFSMGGMIAQQLAAGLRMKDAGEDLLHISVVPRGHFAAALQTCL